MKLLINYKDHITTEYVDSIPNLELGLKRNYSKAIDKLELHIMNPLRLLDRPQILLIQSL
jgi:hypothetical protein